MVKDYKTKKKTTRERKRSGRTLLWVGNGGGGKLGEKWDVKVKGVKDAIPRLTEPSNTKRSIRCHVKSQKKTLKSGWEDKT